MSVSKFEVNTVISGRNRTVLVEVHSKRASFMKAINYEADFDESLQNTKDQMPDVEFSSEMAAATTAWDGYKIDDECATIFLRTDIPLLATTIMHEAIHAALCIYSMDNIIMDNEKAKALKHVNGRNEVIPHLVDDITHQIGKHLKKRGITVENIDFAPNVITEKSA